jgi:apolipoprotein N-acyltransferase
MPVVAKLVLYTVLGAAWSLSQVGYSLGFLTWISLVPYLLLIRGETYKSGFWYSLLFGLSAYMVHFWWMPAPVADVLAAVALPPHLAVLGWAAGIAANMVVCTFHGLVYAFMFLVSRFIAGRYRSLFYLVFPIVGTVLDAFFPKLWYDLIGYSQYMHVELSQVADLFGVPLISLLVFAANTGTAWIIDSFLLKKTRTLSLVFTIGTVAAVGFSIIYGFNRLDTIRSVMNEAPKARFGMVQGNYSGLDKKDRGKQFEMINSYNEYSRELLDDDPDIIIWPESAIPVMYDTNAVYYKSVKKFKEVPLLFGLHLSEENPEYRALKALEPDSPMPAVMKRRNVYNSLVLTSDKAMKLNHYNKIKLLPFVEEFPIKFLNSILHFINLSEFSRGAGPVIMETGDIRFSPNICYEAIIPSFVRKSLVIDDREANVIINCTNDSWFGATIEPAMHLNISGFRSIENRKSMVRVTCTGYTALFDPTGQYRPWNGTRMPSPLYEPYYEVQEAPLMEIDTVYRSGGWLFRYVLLGFTAIFAAWSFILRIRYRTSRIEARRYHKYRKALIRHWTYS